MKQRHYLNFLFLLLFSVNFFSCSDDNDERNVVSGITSHSWTEGTSLKINSEEVLSVSFNALAAWTASIDSDWCTLQPQSGGKGQNTLKLQVATAAFSDRSATVTIRVEGYNPTTFKVAQKAGAEATEDMEVNSKVDQYLRKMYLWNDEYKTLDLDFSKNYEDFFYGALGSMTTNVLDKKMTEDGKYYLFSYIEKRNNISRSRAALVEKELAYSYGITGFTPVRFIISGVETMYFCVQGVYPDSPAAKAGIKRGDMISGVNGNKLTVNNYVDYYYELLAPASVGGLSLTVGLVEQGTEEVSVSSEATYCNPVIYNKVEEIAGRKIGYLVYSGFDMGFDQEVFDMFKKFKSEGVTDLILDLRYNGGGHTWSANLIASCIAGKASEGKVFSSLRYNKERMKELNDKREEELFFYSFYPNLETPLYPGALNLPKVYCLVGEGTASSSELVINSLRGIDVEVVLIGERTTGKNVGMEVENLTVGNSVYRVVPITFQSYNAKGYGDYEDGFAPDFEMDETNPSEVPGMFYIHREYGTKEEPLYAKAVECITGQSSSVVLRSMENVMEGKVHKLPPVYRPGCSGMLKEAAK